MEQRNETEFEKIAMAFPGLRDAAGVSPWNPNQLDIWAAEEAGEPAAIAAAQFLLSLWNRSCQWQCGAFDLHQALEAWDSPHRLCFLDWINQQTGPS